MFTVDFTKAPKETSLPLSKFKLTGDGVDYRTKGEKRSAELAAQNDDYNEQLLADIDAAQGGGTG